LESLVLISDKSDMEKKNMNSETSLHFCHFSTRVERREVYEV
jgi:hypothetical protein